MTYVNMIEDANGDLIDIDHYCSAHCFTQGTGQNADGARWPCPEQTDYPQYCPTCGDLTVPALDDEASS